MSVPYTQFGARAESDKLLVVQQKTAEVAGQIRQNIDVVIERGEKIGDLRDRSEELDIHALAFAKRSREARCAMCWQSYRMLLLLLVVVVLLIVVLYFIIKSSS